jgi:hypothetical protein|eukprot:COSAG01_NODE_8509_length_2759_cov_11.963910_3_plen_130_part_00
MYHLCDMTAIGIPDRDLPIFLRNWYPSLCMYVTGQIARPSQDVGALHVGCRLLSINGVSVEGVAFADARKLTSERPLALVFAEEDQHPDLATLQWRPAGSWSSAVADLVSSPTQPLSLIGMEGSPPPVL